MADLLDILTEAEAKRAAFGTDATGHVDQVARANTAVSRRIDALIGPVVQRTVTEHHDGGVGVLYPRQTPVVSITSVIEWDGSTQTPLTADSWGTAGAADGYYVETVSAYSHNTKIWRQAAGTMSLFASGTRSVQLVYVAGRYADTASVDELYKEAAAEILRRLWNREAGAWARGADPFDEDQIGSPSRLFRAVDFVVDELLGHEKKPPAVA